MFCLLFLNFSPIALASTQNSKNQTETVVYTSKETKNKVVEVKTDSSVNYVVIASPVTSDEPSIDEQSDKSKINKDKDKDKDRKDETTNQRTYFAFAKDLEEAKKIAECVPEIEQDSPGEVTMSAKKNFWHYSYIESYTSGGYLYYHTYLSPTDVNYITATGLIIASTLAGALVATGVVTAAVGVVIAGIASLAIINYFHFTTNPNGSLDLWKRHVDLNINNSYVEPGEKLGNAEAGTGYWKTYYWPSSQPGYGI